MLYWDTSARVKLYVSEADSAQFVIDLPTGFISPTKQTCSF